MSLRYIAGFLSSFYNPLEVANPPTGASASAGEAEADVSFTAPSNTGGSAITGYGVISTPGDFTATGAASPITVTGLTNGTSYTFKVWAINSYGPSAYSDPTSSVTPNLQRGLFAGGEGNVAGRFSSIEYISIATTGNSTYFGDLTDGRIYFGAGASSTRAIWGGGYPYSGPYVNIIDYVTIFSTGNATDFGDMTYQPYGNTGTSNSTRMLLAGGSPDGGSSTYTYIDYITIASTGNAASFGNLTVGRYQSSACSSTTRSIFANGATAGGSQSNIIDYVTIASTGNATDFGDLLQNNSNQPAACSSNTRGCIGGGYTTVSSNVIQYITIATTGNAIDFGDLTSPRYRLGATSSPTRGVWASGQGNGQLMDYVTISSTGNAVNFGNLIQNLIGNAGTSSCHGGI
jgi:hypothetical protein